MKYEVDLDRLKATNNPFATKTVAASGAPSTKNQRSPVDLSKKLSMIGLPSLASKKLSEDYHMNDGDNV